MSEDKYSQWETLVTRVAKFVSTDFPDTDWEDLFQDLMMYILETKGVGSADGEHAYSRLYRKAVKICWETRKTALTLSAQYAYRTSDVKNLLETVFNYEEWDVSWGDPMDESRFRDDWLAHNSDIKRAYGLLPDTYKKEVFLRYALREFPEGQAAKKRLSRAIERLTDILNFYLWSSEAKGLGTRQVISNAQAQAILGEGYE